MGHYESLYQGRKVPIQAPAPSPQPIGVSMVDHLRNLGQLPGVDAGGRHFTDSEREQARQIRQLMAEGRFGIGQIIPHRLMPLVFDGAIPEDMKEMQASAGSVTARLARAIDASLATDPTHDRRGLATDTQAPRPRNDLAPHNHQLSHKLAQVLGDHQGTLPEELFDSQMLRCGVTDIAERISLKTEAMSRGLMRPRGSQQSITYSSELMYTDDPTRDEDIEIVENADGSTSLHLRGGKVDKQTLEKMREMLKRKPGPKAKAPSGEGLTLKASADDGTCAYDKTAFSVASGLNKV